MNKNVILQEGKTYLNINLSGIKVYYVQQEYGSKTDFNYEAILLGPNDNLAFGSRGTYIRSEFVLSAKEFPVKTIVTSGINSLSFVTDNFNLIEDTRSLEYTKYNFISAAMMVHNYHRINKKRKELAKKLKQYF